jgi:hypothetical protein
MKKIRGDKPPGVVIHTYMEISHRNTLCNYLYLKQAKMSCFTFIFFSFFFYKIREQEGQNRSCPVRRIDNNGRGEVMGKGGRRVNTVQKMCAHVRKCKNETC